MGQRIGLFGGTFDPVHEGHLAIVRSLVSQLGVLVRMLPAYVPGHRGAGAHRHAPFLIGDLDRRLGSLQRADHVAPVRRLDGGLSASNL